jgi:four helix bundle protein
MRENDLLGRTFDFGVKTLKHLRTLPTTTEYQIIKHQLGKSATSIGANYEEAQAGFSKADFKNKVRISLKEAREANYWLRVLKALETQSNEELDSLIKESTELKNIIVNIINKLN